MSDALFLASILASLKTLSQMALRLQTFDFLKKSRREDIESRVLSSYPGVSVIIPLKGIPDTFNESLDAILKQNYPGPFEVLVCVHDPNDPGVEHVKNYIQLHDAQSKVRLILTDQVRGLNPKNKNVYEGIRVAKFDWIYSNDVDMFPAPNHLKICMNQVKANPNDFTTCLSVHTGSRNFFAHLESLGCNLDFLSYFMGFSSRKNPCLVNGGGFLLNKTLLNKIGGYETCLNLLTEDLYLSNELKRIGAQSHLSPSFISTRQTYQSFKGYALRQTRWIMIARCFKPLLILMAFLTQFNHSILLLFLFTGEMKILQLLLGLFVLKIVQMIDVQLLLKVPANDVFKAPLIIFFELMVPIFLIRSLYTNEVIWESQKIRVRRDGRLVSG